MFLTDCQWKKFTNICTVCLTITNKVLTWEYSNSVGIHCKLPKWSAHVTNNLTILEFHHYYVQFIIVLLVIEIKPGISTTGTNIFPFVTSVTLPLILAYTTKQFAIPSSNYNRSFLKFRKQFPFIRSSLQATLAQFIDVTYKSTLFTLAY